MEKVLAKPTLKQKIISFFSVRANLYFVGLLVLGVLLRIIRFGITPTGLNQDEAFAGYEAYSLANYGMDSAGYFNPVYFVSWGSGMNVLESYLAVPFVKIFGLNVYTIRLPQLIIALISLPIVYLTAKQVFKNNQIALIALGLAVISPWHIMLSRWGLESNLAPGLLLIGLYFFIKGIDKNFYFIISAFFYGITLYAYAISWAVVPLTLLFNGLYLILTKTKFSWKYIVLAVLVLLVFATPLILFVLVNNGLIGEIKTRLISIPKMAVMRDSEIKLSNLIKPTSYLYLLKLIFWQGDGLKHNSTYFGLFYKSSIPFMTLGFFLQVKDFILSVKKKEFKAQNLFLTSLVCAIITTLLLYKPNINRANALHFNLLFSTAIGLNAFFNYFKKAKYLKRIFVVGYSILTIAFCGVYFVKFDKDISYNFKRGVKECVEFVKQNEFEKISVDSDIYYSQILFYDKTPVKNYRQTVKYQNYPNAFLIVDSFENYYFFDNSVIEISDSFNAYIIAKSDRQRFIDSGYNVQTFYEFSVAYKL